MRLLVLYCLRSTSWWTGVVDQSARTHTTASIGGHRMRWQCGRVVAGQTSGIQPAVLGAQDQSCSVCATTLQRSRNGHELTATISMTPRNGNLGSRMASAIFLQLRSPSIQQSSALRLPRQLRGGQCVLDTPSSMCRGPHRRVALGIETIGLTSILEHCVSGL